MECLQPLRRNDMQHAVVSPPKPAGLAAVHSCSWRFPPTDVAAILIYNIVAICEMGGSIPFKVDQVHT